MSTSLKRKSREEDDLVPEKHTKRLHRDPSEAARYSATPELEEPGVARMSLPNIRGPPPTNPPPLQQPFQLLSFSYTQERKQVFDDSALRYYLEPPKGADLTHRYEHWTKRPEERGRLDGLLESCLRPEAAGERTRANVITWRGVMTKILSAPYEDRDGWILNVMFLHDTLYFEEHMTDEKLAEKENLPAKHRLQTYFGYAFESYCTIDMPPREMTTEDRRHRKHAMGCWGGDVDTNVQWCSVVKTKIGNNIRLILGGEVDCVKDRYTGQPDTFVELKTSMIIRNDGDRNRFEKKLLKFYLQSYLLGVPNIVVGFRTPAGAVQTVERLETQHLPRSVRAGSNSWDPAICLKWGLDVLKFIHGLVAKGSHRATDVPMWRLSFTPATGLTLIELDQTQIDGVRNGEDRVGFLPRSYYNAVSGTAASA